MKKFYILLAAILTAVSVNAQSLKFLVDGKTVEAGSTVDITPYLEASAGTLTINPKLFMESDYDGEVTVEVTNKKLTCEPALDANWIKGADLKLTVCIGQCVMMTEGQTITASTDLTSGKPEDTQLHYMGNLGDEQNVDELVIEAECTLKCSFEGKDYNLTLVINKTGAGVNDIMTDSEAKAEYFDLQGRKIANPSTGLYIVRKGAKVKKTFIR